MMMSTEKRFEECIQKAVKEFNISERKAALGLMNYMCQHGTIEDFKNFMNYYIKNQGRWNFN